MGEFRELHPDQRSFGTNHDEIVAHAHEEGFMRGMRVAIDVSHALNRPDVANALFDLLLSESTAVLANMTTRQFRERFAAALNRMRPKPGGKPSLVVIEGDAVATAIGSGKRLTLADVLANVLPGGKDAS
jgi:hypothetical protein